MLPLLVVAAVLLLHELAHLVCALLRGTAEGIVVGFVRWRFWQPAFGVVLARPGMLEAVAPQIAVPLMLLPLLCSDPAAYVLALAVNAAGGLLDAEAAWRGRKGERAAYPFFGLGIFFRPLRVRLGRM